MKTGQRDCCRNHWEADATSYSYSISFDNSSAVLMNAIGMPFIVCAKCGNKRCPKATDCELDCTGSNDPGQPGSIYG